MSLKILLKNKIEADERITRDDLRLYTDNLNFDMATGDRKLRELTEEKIIQPIFKKNYIVAYRIAENGQKQPPASVSGQNTNNMPDKLKQSSFLDISRKY